jgi:hypothetical protein
MTTTYDFSRVMLREYEDGRTEATIEMGALAEPFEPDAVGPVYGVKHGALLASELLLFLWSNGLDIEEMVRAVKDGDLAQYFASLPDEWEEG